MREVLRVGRSGGGGMRIFGNEDVSFSTRLE
jgi:hypothetical protein